MSEYLRDRAEAFQERFGAAGIVIAVIALVVALGGTAIAASGLNSKQKKEVTKIAKQQAGKPGAAGATGPAGSAGPKGDAGSNGKDGTNGNNGQSVTGTPIPPEAACGTPSGVKYTLGATSTNVCSGENGVLQPGEKLCEECTETGTWSALGEGATFVTLSYTIPLTSAIANPADAHFLKPGEDETTECPGTAANPEAASGQLCVYAEELTKEGEPGEESVLAFSGFPKSYTSGAVVLFFGNAPFVKGLGTWAVTAPEAP
jgi:hypothetical protein